jgi:hypothetical protein
MRQQDIQCLCKARGCGRDEAATEPTNNAAARNGRANPRRHPMRVAASPVAGRGRGDRALTGSETDERPEAMLLSRRIICILLLTGRQPPQPDPDLALTANPSLVPPPSSPSRSSSSSPPPPLLRLRYAASPMPEVAIWEGRRRGRPSKLREVSGVVVAGSRREARGENFWSGRGGRGKGSLVAPLDFAVLFLAL